MRVLCESEPLRARPSSKPCTAGRVGGLPRIASVMKCLLAFTAPAHSHGAKVGHCAKLSSEARWHVPRVTVSRVTLRECAPPKWFISPPTDLGRWAGAKGAAPQPCVKSLTAHTWKSMRRHPVLRAGARLTDEFAGVRASKAVRSVAHGPRAVGRMVAGAARALGRTHDSYHSAATIVLVLFGSCCYVSELPCDPGVSPRGPAGAADAGALGPGRGEALEPRRHRLDGSGAQPLLFIGV